MARTVTLVLLDDEGALLGQLAPFEVDVPWWPDTASVVAGARERYGLDLTVLRILGAERPEQPGGAVTYLAQTDRVPGGLTTPVEVDLSPQPKRTAYAEPGGPLASLRWAAAELDRLGLPLLGQCQQRTWNLSAIWRLDTSAGPVWLKQVPFFFAHEAAVLRWLASVPDSPAPRLLAAADSRMLLAHVPGKDLYEAGLETRRGIASDMHRLQLASLAAVPDVPDLRGPRLADFIRSALGDRAEAVPGAPELIAELPERLAEVAACRLPDTLVHGDLHPGNVIGDGDRRTLIDWGDSFLGNPGFDILRLSERLSTADADVLVGEWVERWRRAAPGADPARAVELLRPVAALRNAAVYSFFLANIEPAEHPYHASDPATWLTEAVKVAG